MKQPCFRVQQLIQQAQAIIDANKGVQGNVLREALGIKVGYFKLVSVHLRCQKQRHTGYQYTYYPINFVATKPPKHSDELLTTVEKMQSFIDKHDGVTGLQIRIEVGMDVKFFTKCLSHIKASRAKANGVTVFYKIGESPATVKIIDVKPRIEIPASPFKTRWVNMGGFQQMEARA